MRRTARSIVLVKPGGNVTRPEPQLLAQPQARQFPAFDRVVKPALAHLPQPVFLPRLRAILR